MGRGKELKSNIFIRNHHTDYLSPADKYVFAQEVPKYRFNVIGAGMMGYEHMQVTLLEGRAQIHGIYDTNPASSEHIRQKFAAAFPAQPPLVVYDSLTAACNDAAVDGLIICTPNFTHIEVVRTAIQSGKHILLEKPMATSVADAFEIAKLAADYPAVFQIGLQYRYKPICAEAIHEVLERKAIGNVKMVTILEQRVPFLDKVGQWNKFSKFSGGTLVEKCCHYFDLLNLFAGARPTSVYATGGMAVNFSDFAYEGEKADILDSAAVTVTYANGVQTTFNLCMFAPMFYEEIIICGDEGRLHATENQDFLPIPRPSTHLEIHCGENRPSKISTPCYPAVIQQSGHHGATYYEHKYFVDNIEGKPTSTATVTEGLWSIIVGAAAEASVRTGKVVEIEAFLQECGCGMY